MPRIFDNIENKLLPVLQEKLFLPNRADFYVRYINVHGWKELDSCAEKGSADELPRFSTHFFDPGDLGTWYVDLIR